MDMRFFLTSLLVTTLFIPTAFAFQAPDENVRFSSANLETVFQGDLADEKIGVRTGSLDYSTVDVRLQGLGPDITVRRSFAKTGIGPVEFGSWLLDVPRIVLKTSPAGRPAGGAGGNNASAGICNDYSHPRFNPLEGNKWSKNAFADAPTLHFGDGNAESLITLRSDLKGGQFPADTKYVTTSNVIVKCMEVDGRFDGYEVKTPDGLTYELTKLSRIPGDFVFGGAQGTNIVSVSKIKDQFGNEVTYEYREVRKPNAHGYGSQFVKPNRYYVEEINATDGRRVTINYDNNALEGEYPLVSSVVVNDAGDIAGEAVWSYDYTGLTANMGSSYCHFLSASPAEKDRCWSVSRRWYMGTYLEEVTRPDGSTWEFDYRGPIVGSVLDCCTVGGAINSLSRVKFPYGGVVQYEFDLLDYQFFDDSGWVYESPVVARRTVTDPITGSTHVWNYSYAKLTSPDATRTTISLPDGSSRQTWFYRSGAFRGLPYKSTVTQNGSAIRTTNKSYDAGTNLGSYIGVAKVDTHYSAEKERVIDGKYRRTVQSRDQWFRETLVEETGTSTRTIETAYVPFAELNADLWMLNLVDETTVRQPNTGESAIVDREFYGTGLLRSLERFGVSKGNFGYTSKGELASRTTEASQEIREDFSNFAAGRPRNTTFNDGTGISREYDVFGNVISETDELGNQTTSKHDALGRLRWVKRPLLDRKEFTYHLPEAGQPARAEIKFGTETFATKYFDGFGRVLASEVMVNSTSSTQQNDDQIKQYRYDYQGNLAFESHPTNQSVATGEFDQPVSVEGISHSYDTLSRIIESVDTSTGGSVEYCYDGVCQYGLETYDVEFGRLVVDERGYKKLERYDCYSDPDNCEVAEISRKVNNPSKTDYVVQSSAGSPPEDKWVTINIDRNVLGNPLTIENDGVIRLFTYHPGTSLIETQTEPEALPVSYSYYPNGSIETKVQGNRQKSYQYNKRGRLTHVNSPTGNLLEADYYPNGKIQNAWTRVGDEDFRTHFTYTAFGSVNTQQQYPNNGAGPIDYDYNSIGYLDGMTYPHGDVVEYFPDQLGRTTKLKVNGSELASVVRKDEKQVLSLANGVVVEKAKNDRGLDTNLTVRPEGVVVALPGAIDRLNIMEYVYTYDRSDNLLQRRNELTPSLTKNFAYDGLSRLTWDGANYDYDANSNLILNAGRVINYQGNQVESVESPGSARLKEFDHDAFGRLTSTNVNGNLVRDIQYNDLDRVESIVSAGASTLYTYDAFGALAKSDSLDSSGTRIDTTTFVKDLSGRVLEKRITSDATGSPRLVRLYYIENSLIAEKENVENAPPIIEMNSISHSTEGGQKLLLNAEAFDREDGDLSDSIAWISNKDGAFATGGATSSTLSVGLHSVHAEVEDSQGLKSASNPITVSISPGIHLNAQVREILKTQPDSYEFNLEADPVLSGNFEFFFNGEGMTQSGSVVTVPNVDFSGANTISVCQENSNVCSNVLEVSTLSKLNDTPDLSEITISGSGAVGEPMTFRATATDREEGDLTNAIKWYSVREPPDYSYDDQSVKRLPAFFFDQPADHTGGTYIANFVEPGTYFIKADISDTSGATAVSDQESFTIYRNLEAHTEDVHSEYDCGPHICAYKYTVDIQVGYASQFSHNLNFYKRGRYGGSWYRIGASQSPHDKDEFTVGQFTSDDISLKVCTSSGDFCSDSFTFSAPPGAGGGGGPGIIW